MNLKDEISKKYNLEIISIEKNEESTDGNVYILETNNGKFVAKLYTSLNHTKSMIKIHTSLYNKGFYIPYIVKTKDNLEYIKLDDRLLVLYSFLDGEKIKKEINSLLLIDNLGKELRRLHDETDKNIYALDEINFNNSERSSLLHFDLTKDNIFYNSERVGFIDFDDAKYGSSIYDVSILIALLFISKSRGIDIIGIKTFINSYYGKDESLRQSEIKLIKKCAIEWIDYTLNKQEFEPSTKESFEIKKKLLELNDDMFE